MSDRGEDTVGAPEEPAAAARTPGAGHPSVARLAVMALLCVTAAGLLAGLLPRARMAIRLQAWSQRGPREAAERFCAGARSGDADTLRGVMAKPNQVAVADDGAVAVKVGAANAAKLIHVEALRVDQAAKDAHVEYSYLEANPTTMVVLDLPAGDGELQLYVDRVGGEWKVTRVAVHGLAMRAVMQQQL
jgi:hypothetical protein